MLYRRSLLWQTMHGNPVLQPPRVDVLERSSNASVAYATGGSKHNAAKVVGMGSACLDYLAQVASWPKPDDKLRTENLQTQGGGNCANALTAAARLGLRPSLVSKIGDDGIGEQIIAQLHGDGVDTTHVIRGQDSPSPFTYIIVDRTGGTRTCIHTPSAPLEPSELGGRFDDILAGAAVVYFDGRLTDAAVPLAKAAREAGIPVLVEAERLRPQLETLLAKADYVTTSAHFPQAWTGEEDIADALVSTLQRLPHAAWMFTTLGSRGAVLLQRAPLGADTGADPSNCHTAITNVSFGREAPKGCPSAEEKALADLLPAMWTRLERQKAQLSQEPACMTGNGTEIREGAVIESDAAYRLRRSDQAGASDAVAGRAELAAAQEAQRNAGGGDAASYRMHSADARGGLESSEAAAAQPSQLVARVVVASSAVLAKEAVRDTTGAGDACVGTLLYGICNRLTLPETMRLAAVVAAAKCTGVGARAALPRRDDIRSDLLH